MNTATVIQAPPTASSIKAAYVKCEEIARREAKNFYYAFRVLPKHKRNAMCAIYAFMRRADDIADDESLSIDERRIIMSQWMAAWRDSSNAAHDPVFLAVRDTQQRFLISDELLEDLIRGTKMDLEDAAPGVVKVPAIRASDVRGNVPSSIFIYEHFDDLYRYCYLVASVVGLVCIRIFGYKDPRAEVLAEQVGIAFQLTNILRDVKEDAERQRIYIPCDDLAAAGIQVRQLVLTASGAMPPKTVAPVLLLEAQRAREYYKAADELIPLLDLDSRAAMWVLVTIYRGLLDRITEAGFDVFSKRIRVSSSRKLFILLVGALKSMRHRVFA